MIKTAKLKIIADENILNVADIFAAFGDVECLPGREINTRSVSDADVLLVRSITPVNKALLSESTVKFVGSATIGTDHIDEAWLASQNIHFANAPGCNASAVGDYVIASLSSCEPGWLKKTVGIVGCGNVGGGLYKRLKALGVHCRCYDPFLDQAENTDFQSYTDVLKADIICFHTPLTRKGSYPTWHLLDETALNNLNPDTLILNAGRGEVIDNQALLPLLKSGQLRAILDVWEGEPEINLELLDQVILGTPHIAGYSIEGKQAGTDMIYTAFTQWLQGSFEDDYSGGTLFVESFIESSVASKNKSQKRLISALASSTFESIILSAYDPQQDFERMQSALFQRAKFPAAKTQSRNASSSRFDQLRKTYPQRREFSHFIVGGSLSKSLKKQLEKAGFSLSC